mgnify:CR=1 FL=1
MMRTWGMECHSPGKTGLSAAYMARIVRNISLKCYWKKGSCQAKQSLHPCFAGSRGVSSRPKSAEEEVEARELARVIACFLDTLSAENRVIFMRRYWFSDSCRDIAGLVGLSEKNISVRLARIRRKLKQYLAEREAFL